jgi:hypothetical protein
MLRENLYRQIEDYNNSIESQRIEKMQRSASEHANVLAEYLQGTDYLAGFEVEEDLKRDVLRSLITPGSDGKRTEFIQDYIDDPEGLIQTALAVKMLPQIQRYVNQLHDELEYQKRLVSQFRPQKAAPRQSVNFIPKEQVPQTTEFDFYDLNS